MDGFQLDWRDDPRAVSSPQAKAMAEIRRLEARVRELEAELATRPMVRDDDGFSG